MGVTKKHIHTQHQLDMARLFKALAHPARIAIVENLLLNDNLNCNDLRSYIELSQSTISAHIKELHDAGILGLRVIGTNAYYEINKIVIDQICDYLDKISEKTDTDRQNRLSIYFAPAKNTRYQFNTA